jgi:hypothetical protein
VSDIIDRAFRAYDEAERKVRRADWSLFGVALFIALILFCMYVAPD